MVFYNLKYIYFLILALILLGLFYKGNKRKNEILALLSLKKKSGVYLYMIFFAYLIAIFALTGPRKLSEVEKVEVKGADIYILIDTSKSMGVEDVAPSRMEKAKYEIRKIIEGLKGDRISFIPFTDSAYVQMPLTDDYDMALMYLESIDTELINTSGTDFSNALTLAEKSFDKTGTSKIVLFVSDGENHSEWKRDSDLNIYAIGIGTQKGGVIPTSQGFIKDENGSVVISRLESDILKKIAQNGKYFESNNMQAAYEKFLKSIETIKRTANRSEEIKRYREFYQYFLLAAFLLILIAYYMEEKR